MKRLLAGVCVLALAAPASAETVVANDRDGVLYDVDLATGTLSNPRATGIDLLVDVEYSSDGRLWGLSAEDDSFYRIDPATGAASRIAKVRVDVSEGDLVFDPISRIMYGSQAIGPELLYTIDLATGAVDVIGAILTGIADISAMSFDSAGTLYVIDSYGQSLLTVDPATAEVTGSVLLSRPVGHLLGMDFDPVSGTMYVIENSLLTLDLGTGELTPVGLSPSALAASAEVMPGLAIRSVPEPTSLALALTGLFCLVSLGRRLRSCERR